MMLLENFSHLYEERLMVNDQVFNIYKNLSPMALKRLLDNSKMRNVRGLIVGTTIYYWDSFYATHHQVADELGIPYDPSDRLHVWDNRGQAVIEMLDGDSSHHRSLDRFIENPLVTLGA